MSDRNFDRHPSDADLLLYFEGELTGRLNRSVADHVESCWECRATMQQYERGIEGLVDYRREFLVPSLPPAVADVHDLRRRLPARPARRAFPWPQFLRPAAGAAAAAIAGILVVVLTLQPPALTAAVMLRNVARASAAPVPARHVQAQKIQIRRGSQVLEHEVMKGRSQAAGRPLPWEEMLAGLPVDIRDPLNPEPFEKWHAAQSTRQDVITEESGLVTLTTAVPELRAALVVRRADWHTVAERFEVPGYPTLEIREISFEVRKEEQVRMARVLPPVPAHEIAPQTRQTIVEPAPDLEVAEIHVREQLHQTGSDTAESLVIFRANGRVVVEGFVEDASRRQELTERLAFPGVQSRLLLAGDLVVAPSSARPATTAPAAYPTTPPLARALWDRMGGMEPANNYLDMLRSSWTRTLPPSQALARLAERYPRDVLAQLSPEVRARVDALAADYSREVASALRVYLEQAGEPLNAAGINVGVPPPESQCGPWQDVAGTLPANLQSLQTVIRRLFLVDYAETPQDLSVDALSRDAGHFRSRLRQQLRCLVQQP